MVSSTTARVNFSRSMSSAPSIGGALHLGREFLLGRGIERQQIERPEQRGRGGLMAGEDHGRDLIAELLVGEGRAGLGIARGAHQVEQIARRRAFVLAGGAALGHQHADESRPALAEAGAGKIPRASASPAAAPGRGNADAPGCSPYSITKSRSAAPWRSIPNENMVRPAISSVIRCIDLAQIHRRMAGGLELGDGLVGRRHHVRDQRRHGARRKRRRERSALVFPGAALGDQQPFAEHRPQHPEAGRACAYNSRNCRPAHAGSHPAY